MLFNDWGNTANPGEKHGKCIRELILSLSGVVFLIPGRVVDKPQYVSVSRIVSVDLVHTFVGVAVYQVKGFKLDTLLLRSHSCR